MYLVLILVTIFCFIVQLPELQLALQWDAQAISDGQWWRILTGNFTHTNIWHLLMNTAGLWVISYLFRPTRITLFLSLIIVSLCIGLALIFSDIQIYLGLSGTLHGLFAYLALSEALSDRKSSWLLVFGLIAKIAWEQIYGASDSTSSLISARVAIEAHLAGGAIGLIAAALAFLSNRSKQH